MARRDIVVFGGSGFIGRYLVRRLANDGWRVIVAVRYPEAASFLQPLGDVGQIVPVKVDVADAQEVASVTARASAIVNLVGILFERGKRNFRPMHVDAARNIGEAARKAEIETVVQISANGASLHASANYARSKAAAEQVLQDLVPTVRILRPSIVFGQEDGFFNLFGRLAVFSPVLPLFGGGMTRFQPVYVDDVAAAIVACVDDADRAGTIYELGGPSTYTFKNLMGFVRRETQRKVLLMPMPFFVAHVQALFLQFLPKPLLTPDQVRLMKVDNVADPTMPGLKVLGINPTTVEMIVPHYLSLYRRGGLRGRPRFG